MIVDSALYREGQRIEVDCFPHEFDKIRGAATDAGDFVWVGLYKPSAGELDDVAKAFGLHPLAVEDALKAHQRPKLERYDDSIFLTLKTLWYVDADDQVETGEINLFVGRDFVITVRHGRGSELHSARNRLEGESAVLTHGPSSVVYAVCDTVVDSYIDVIDELQVDVDEIETSVFSADRTDDSNRIYILKREIAEVRRAVLPLREPMRKFADGLVHGVSRGRRRSSATSRTTSSRSPTSWIPSTGCSPPPSTPTWPGSRCSRTTTCARSPPASRLVAVPTLIAGIYGMNFSTCPSWAGPSATPSPSLLMAVISGLLWFFFKRSGWL